MVKTRTKRTIMRTRLMARRTAAIIMIVAPAAFFPCKATALSVARPFVGSVVDKEGAEFIVVGTSHYKCQSAQEVRAVIEEERPDAVLVELDPERVVRLTKEYAMTSPDQDFGADFLSAIQVAQDLDIPLFLGDESTQATKARFINTLASPETYNPARLLAALFPNKQQNEDKEPHQINVLQTFLQDPRKVMPLASSLALSLVLVTPLVCLGQGVDSSSPQDSNAALLNVVFSVLFSLIISTKVFNTLIADRDDILALKSLQAAQVVQSLKRKETIRKTWRFTVDGTTTIKCDDNDRDDNNNQQSMIPLFTLKNPLKANGIRNLNLFEPRWLAMIDSLAGQEDPCFGCVTCTNKFYSVVKGPDGQESRYADVIFQRQGRMAQMVQITEGLRPSGARKVNTQIKGEANQFVLTSPNDVLVSPEGYLMAPRNQLLPAATMEGTTTAATRKEDERVKVVVVVGLLHANGVLNLLGK